MVTLDDVSGWTLEEVAVGCLNVLSLVLDGRNGVNCETSEGSSVSKL
jgi:hypothetical protein